MCCVVNVTRKRRILDDDVDEFVSLGNQDVNSVGLCFTESKQPVAVEVVENVFDMMIEFKSVEYATHEKWTTGHHSCTISAGAEACGGCKSSAKVPQCCCS